jgi:hypothetical protein
VGRSDQQNRDCGESGFVDKLSEIHEWILVFRPDSFKRNEASREAAKEGKREVKGHVDAIDMSK